MSVGSVVEEAVGEVKQIAHDVVEKVEEIFGKDLPAVFTEFETVYDELKAKAASLKKLATDSIEYETLKTEITADVTLVKTKFDALVASL